MEIGLLFQPVGSKSCGQHVLAMLMQKTLAETTFLVGHNSKTRTKEIGAILNRHGFINSEKLIRLKRDENPPYAIAIIRISWKGTKTSHWILKYGDQIYCPMAGQYNLGEFPYIWEGKYTSYLAIESH